MIQTREYWFDFKKNKFLHNIDTFYYSVKLLEDFTDDSKMILFLNFGNSLIKRIFTCFPAWRISTGLFFRLRSFSQPAFWDFCWLFQYMSGKSGRFDIFIAPVVPHGSDGGFSVTSWDRCYNSDLICCGLYGVSWSLWTLLWICENRFCDYFGLHIAYCQENRIDIAGTAIT